MPKTTDVPHELRALNRIFSEKDYSWDYADSFRDWVDFLVESFMPIRQGEYERLKQKHGDLDWFVRMTQEWVRVQHQQVGEGGRDWYDALGSFYECLSTRGKRQIMGQFFTPETVVDFMTQITTSPEQTGKELRVNDPASGSGRMLLAFHAMAPGNYQYGADLDSICARMTAVNMCLHGCVGQAVCMNSLDPDDWRFGYDINRTLRYTGVPTIIPIRKEQCHTWQMWQQEKADWEARQKQTPEAERNAQPAPVPPAIKAARNGQLSLF